MKKSLFLFSLTCLAMLLLMPNIQAQTAIASWHFGTALTPTAGNNVYQTHYDAECGEGTIYYDGTNGSSVWIYSTLKTSTTASVPGDVQPCGQTAKTNSIQIINANPGANDSCIVFKFSTIGFENITIGYESRGSSTGFTTHTWAHSTDGVNFTTVTSLEGMNTSATGTWPRYNVSFSNFLDDAEFAYIRLTFTGATGSTGNNYIDNIVISGSTNAATTELPVFDITAGRYCDAQTIAMSCPTENAAIYYTLDGSTPTETDGTLYEEPITLSTTTTVKAIAIAPGFAASALQSATYTFASEVADIASFKAADNNAYCKIGTPITVVHRTGNYMYVQDENTGLVIYGSGLPNYTNGTVIASGACGVRTLYTNTNNNYKMIELTDFSHDPAAVTTSTPVQPTSVTIADLRANWENYDSRLVEITPVTFNQGNYSYTTTMHQGLDSILLRNLIGSISYSMPVPTLSATVRGFALNSATETDSQFKSICPRSIDDIIDLTPSITIESPINGMTYESADPISIDITTSNFEFENGSMIQFHAVSGTVDTTFNCPNAMMLALIESTNLPLPVGSYTLSAAFVNADLTPFSPIVSDTIHFEIVATHIAIEPSVSALTFTETGETQTFTVNAFHLDEAITLSTDNSAFTISPTTLSNSATNETVSVTFIGTADASATLTLTSGDVTATVALTSDLPIDEVIYSTGFEANEGFAAGNVYNNTSEAFTGPEGQQWGTTFGTPSTTSPAIGEQSMQMRWYTSTPNNFGYTYTNFNLHNVTQVAFSAKNSNGLKVNVSRSVDGGLTYEEDSVYTLSSNVQRFIYNVSDSGQFYSVRIKFQLALPETAPSSTSRLYLDSVVVYGVTGLEPQVVADPVISEASGTYFEPISVTISCETENATIRYTTDGTIPTEEDNLYTSPLLIDSSMTLTAKAFHASLDPSTPASATYTFPTEVSTIADFKAANTATNNTPYRITGDVTFVFRSGRNIFIQDNTGGLMVYDNSTSVVTGTYNEGDIISGGICGTYSLYHGMTEMIPLTDWAASTSQTTVVPETLTVNDISSDYDTWESRLVFIDSVIFQDGFTFVAGTSGSPIDFSDITGTMALYNNFKTLDTTLNAGDTSDLVGFVAIYDGSYRIYPRNNADIIPHPYTAPEDTVPDDSIFIAHYELVNLTVFPNPTTESIQITSDAQGGSIEIINAFGQVIYREEHPTYPMTLSLANRAKGTYFIRITDAKKQVVVSKVVKM